MPASPTVPPTAPPTDPSSPTKIYRVMDSQAEALEAIDQVIAHAQQELMIFDQSPKTLRDRGYGRPQNVDVMRQFLLTSKNSRARHIRISLQDTQGIETELPRLMTLLDQHADLLTIRRAEGDARSVQDVLLIADKDAVWRKPVASHPRSIVVIHDANDVKPYLDRFAEIWQLSGNTVSARSTGL